VVVPADCPDVAAGVVTCGGGVIGDADGVVAACCAGVDDGGVTGVVAADADGVGVAGCVVAAGDDATAGGWEATVASGV
jgi:hypothetical protein